MVTRILTHDDATGACALAELNPYPDVVAGTNTTVTSATDVDGKVTYTVNATGGGGVDTDVSALTLDIDFTLNTLTSTVTENGVTLSDTVALADPAAIACEVAAATGLTTDFWVSEFVNRGHQFDSAAINGYTTPCNISVIAAANGTNSGANSIVSGSDNSNANPNGFTTGAGNTNTGGASLVAGGTNTNASGGALVVGINNDVGTGGFHIVGGNGNTTGTQGSGLTTGVANSNLGTSTSVSGDNNSVAAGTQSNAVSGSFNDIQVGDYNLIAGRNNTILGGNSSIIVGNTNTVTGDTGGLIAGGGNTVTGAPVNFAIVGQTNTLTGNAGSSLVTGDEHLMGSQNGSIIGGRGNAIGNGGINRHIIGGVSVTNPNNNTTVWGNAVAGSPPLSSNRTIELVHGTGNIRVAGTVTAGFVFPGFGEYFVNRINAEEGLFVVPDEKGDGIEIAEAGDWFIGITRNELANSAGGGQEFDNPYYLLDKMGNRVYEEVSYEMQSGTDEDGEPIYVTDSFTRCVTNPDYDAERAEKVEKIGVEFTGRTFLQTHGSLKVGDYVTVGKGGKGVKSKEPTNVRVIVRKSDDLVLVFIK